MCVRVAVPALGFCGTSLQHFETTALRARPDKQLSRSTNIAARLSVGRVSTKRMIFSVANRLRAIPSLFNRGWKEPDSLNQPGTGFGEADRESVTIGGGSCDPLR